MFFVTAIKAFVRGGGAAIAVTACAGGGRPATDGALPLRVMTFNIHHGAGNDACEPPDAARDQGADCGLNLERIAGIIRDAGVDIAALQEVDRFWSRSGMTDQAAKLGALLGMRHCYGPNLAHDADAHAGRPHEYGTLVLSRHPIAACVNTLLPRADTASEQRGLLLASIGLPGRLLRVYNTHLHTREEDRRLQTGAILRHIGAGPGPIVLAGDLNATPDAPYLAPLFARLADVWPAGGQGAGFTSPARPDIPARRRIDYILASPDLGVRRAVTLDGPLQAEASDHYPVIADILLPARQTLPRRQFDD